MVVYVDGNLAFAGELQRSCGKAADDDVTTIDLAKSSPIELPPIEKNGRLCLALGRRSPEPGLLSNQKPSWEESCPGGKENFVSLVTLEGLQAPLGAVSTENVLQSALSAETAELSQAEDDLTLSEQMEKLSGRKRTLSSSFASSPWSVPPSGGEEKSKVASPKHLLPPLDLGVQQSSEGLARAEESLRLRPAELECCSSRTAEGKQPVAARQECPFALDFPAKSSCLPEHLLPGRLTGRTGKEAAVQASRRDAAAPPDKSKSL